MAGKKENIKALFSNSRSRVIILFTAALLLGTVVIGVIKFSSSTGGLNADVNLSSGGQNISATPGKLNQTAQYAALQETQNIEQAQLASQTGASAIPTIIRTQVLGEGNQVIGQKEGEGGVDFSALANNSTDESKRLWIQSLKNADCSKASIDNAVSQGAVLRDLRAACNCEQLKNNGYKLQELDPVCTCNELRAAGFGIEQFKTAGFNASRLKQCGFIACAEKSAGFTAQEMKDAGFSDGELKGAGFTDRDIARAGGLPDGMTADDVRKAGSDVEALKRLRAAGVTAAAIRRISGDTPAALKAAGFSADDLKKAGFSAAEMKKAGFTAAELKQAGMSPQALLDAGFSADDLANAGFAAADIKAADVKNKGRIADCSTASLTAAHAQHISATTIKQTLGCDATAMKNAGYTPVDLKNAGSTAAELKNAGFGLDALKNAGFGAKDLAAAGWTAQQMKNAGMSAQQLKDAGFSASDLKNAGFSPEQLKAAGFDAKALKNAGLGADALHKAGFSAKDVKAAGFDRDQMKQAGFASQELQDAGFSALAGLDTITPLPTTSALTGLASVENAGNTSQADAMAASAKRIDDLRKQQDKQIAAQRYQQKIQQRGSNMLSAANQVLQVWKTVPQQVYVGGSEADGEGKAAVHQGIAGAVNINTIESVSAAGTQANGALVIKTGDVLYAVIDTSVNSDEPGPILATIVSGRLKGAKLIGSFNLPSRADKMIVTFNTLSIPGAEQTQSITAFAIDPNTARTALSSQTDHHYLSRYGALFASTFIEGFGNAFQSANTTITVGGTGGVTDTTVQSGIGRSTLENAVIGLATLGKAWGQVAAQQMSRPTTVQLYAGTGVGVLFTQDLKLS